LGVDVVWIGDDFGMQDRLMISPGQFREFFKPRYDRLFRHLKSINPDIKLAFHTDGYNVPILPDFIEVGVNILNPVQPKSMDPAELKKKFGDKLTFWGTIDNQHTMPFGTMEDVVNETILRLKTVAPGGGLILGPAHNVQPQVPIENIMAFYDTVKKYGAYPIRF
jgi:uroporphyrinogen-III decarboxylase